MYRRILGLVAAFLFLAGVSCKDDPYRAAIRGSDDVANGVHAGIKITAQYYSSGQFNDGQKAFAAKYFTVVTDCNMTFRKSATDVHNAGQTGIQAFLPIADGFVNCVRSSNLVPPDSKTALVLKSTDTAINGVSAMIASAKEKK